MDNLKSFDRFRKVAKKAVEIPVDLISPYYGEVPPTFHDPILDVKVNTFSIIYTIDMNTSGNWVGQFSNAITQYLKTNIENEGYEVVAYRNIKYYSSFELEFRPTLNDDISELLIYCLEKQVKEDGLRESIANFFYQLSASYNHLTKNVYSPYYGVPSRELDTFLNTSSKFSEYSSRILGCKTEEELIKAVLDHKSYKFPKFFLKGDIF